MTSPSALERLAGPGNVLAKELPDAVLSKCHEMRNRSEYEGALDVDERLFADLIGACRKVAEKVRELPPISEKSK